MFQTIFRNSGKIPARIKLKSGVINFYSIPSVLANKKEFVDMSKLLKIPHFVFPNQKNSAISYPILEDLRENIERHNGFVLIIKLEYWIVGRAKNNKYHTEIIVNVKTIKGSLIGSIHDIKTISAD